ncbi:UDP-N-acetylglucosamine 2-epimerase [Sphingomonas vulcanisoli]|uniref:UDP-N-acetylglucosamine 2-epimerase (non-hydrolyzing) n=1 Tax=Sphingomonas vulcanisoli TaxID=1658060 RepID=A0ABX0TSZ1_9SPHN|nr:UDP-N-acetylglucosamine 2-epimerase (non-hydrolyzing) [Sphingomonas vulcanisoli]NIJ06910.1 UDP-N-acetylglucosamine 2-epimerase [Sphingomonas vulcanisoli]
MAIVGTRPEAIKMIPVMRAIRAKPGLELISVTTGQHREMLDQVFEAFGERADHDLAIMTPGQSLPALTRTVLERMTAVYADLKPDIVLVHGDTTSAMAAAMAAFYTGVRIGHVEAGLRSGDLTQPWPEEFNRVTIDSIADYRFAPTEGARAHLENEYNRSSCIFVTGNTGIDALMIAAETLDRSPERTMSIAVRHPELADEAVPLVLVTGHRRESFGKGFQSICDGLRAIAARGDVRMVYPVHLNPEVRGVVKARLGGHPNIRLIDPVDYFEMVWLMRRAKLILTDSGGIQEEAPALGKPVLVMRETTERPEALATGIVTLVGTDPARIVDEARRLLDDPDEYARRARPVFPYGDGKAAGRIAKALAEIAAELTVRR